MYSCFALIFPSENGKALQVWRYENEDSQKDLNYFGNSSLLQQSKPLIATVILYLSNVAHGGQILFPDSEVRGKPSILRHGKIIFNLVGKKLTT